MDPLDPHQRPPDAIRAVYKKYQKMKAHELDRDPDMIQLPPMPADNRLRVVRRIQRKELNAAFQAFAGDTGAHTEHLQPQTSSVLVYEHHDMPGKVAAFTQTPPNNRLP